MGCCKDEGGDPLWCERKATDKWHCKEAEEATHLFKEIEPGVYETNIELITPCPFHEEDYWGACPCDEGEE